MKLKIAWIGFSVLLLVVFLFNISRYEHFLVLTTATRERCPTKNMSYDIRGDIPIPRKEMIINNSAWGPMFPERCQNRPLT